MEKSTIRAFRAIFLLFAFLAFIGICKGAYHQFFTLVICVAIWLCCKSTKRQQMQVVQEE